MKLIDFQQTNRIYEKTGPPPTCGNDWLKARFSGGGRQARGDEPRVKNDLMHPRNYDVCLELFDAQASSMDVQEPTSRRTNSCLPCLQFLERLSTPQSSFSSISLLVTPSESSNKLLVNCKKQ